MQKYKNAEIKKFTFNELRGEHVVLNGNVEAFEFRELNGKIVTQEKASPEMIRQELTLERKHNFKIEDTVRELRGISKQEKNDFENLVEAEVNKRIEQIYQDAYDKGFAKGQDDGLNQSVSTQQINIDQTSEDLVQILSGLNEQTSNVLKKNKDQVYDFVKKFTKWVVLKEIDSGVYLEKLLEKLILEMNVRKNIVLRVGQEQLPVMSDVIKHVEGRVGQLSNIRVEVHADIQHPGIILECENGLIDGSIEGVFRNIDKIFEQVVHNE